MFLDGSKSAASGMSQILEKRDCKSSLRRWVSFKGQPQGQTQMSLEGKGDSGNCMAELRRLGLPAAVAKRRRSLSSLKCTRHGWEGDLETQETLPTCFLAWSGVQPC